MTLDDILKKRISVRRFKNKNICIDAIKKIINAGRLSPSAKNRQPYLYVLVNNQQKNYITQEMRKIDAKIEPTIQFTANIIDSADKLILVFCNNSTENLKSDLLSLGASIENCILKATELGVDSLWCRDVVPIKDTIYNLLNIDNNNYILESALCFGYRAIQPYRKKKKKLEEILIIYE